MPIGAIVAHLPDRVRPLAERTVGWSVANLAFVVFAAASLLVMVGLTGVTHDLYENVFVATKRSWMPVVLTLVAAAGSLAMTVVGKQLVARVRPPVELAVPPIETSPSFPSGHTLNATVLTGVVVYLVLLRTRAHWQRVVAMVAGRRSSSPWASAGSSSATTGSPTCSRPGPSAWPGHSPW